MLEHRRAVLCQRVTRTHARANLGAQIPARQRKLLDLAQRPFKILLHIVRERLQWRNIDNVRVR